MKSLYLLFSSFTAIKEKPIRNSCRSNLRPTLILILLNIEFKSLRKRLGDKTFRISFKFLRRGWDQRLADFNRFLSVERCNCYSFLVLSLHVQTWFDLKNKIDMKYWYIESIGTYTDGLVWTPVSFLATKYWIILAPHVLCNHLSTQFSFSIFSQGFSSKDLSKSSHFCNDFFLLHLIRNGK